MTQKHLLASIEAISWYIQAGEGLPVYIIVPGISCFRSMRPLWDFDYKTVVIYCQHGQVQWHLDDAHLRQVSECLIQRFLARPGYLEGMYDDWQVALQALEEVIDTVNSAASSGLDNAQLVELYDRLLQRAVQAWGHFICIDMFDPHGAHQLRQHLVAAGVHLSEHDLNVLLQAEKPSFVAEERHSMLRIATESSSSTDRTARLGEHQRQFYWAKNNYGHVHHLDVADFRSELEALQKQRSVTEMGREIADLAAAPERVLAAKQAIRQRVSIDGDSAALLRIFSQLGEIRDERKVMSLQIITAQRRLLQHVAERLRVDVAVLEYLAPWEVSEVFTWEPKQLQALRRRKEGCVWIFDGSDAAVFYDAREAREIHDRLNIPILQRHGEVRGMMANRGQARGPVRLIKSVREFARFRDGEVLLTTMTRPDFTPIVRRAAAIVTDEGGITCHASIIARELDCPCIIGTKVATQVFQDGDLVEVDADNGVVRRLQAAPAPAGTSREDGIEAAADEMVTGLDAADVSGASRVTPGGTTAADKALQPAPAGPASLRQDGFGFAYIPRGGAIQRFRDITSADVAVVGGKGANLGELFGRFRVPNGFVVTTAAYVAFVNQHRLGAAIAEQLANLDSADYEALRTASATIKDLFRDAAIHDQLAGEITRALESLDSDSVAVRSSATAEDLAHASFAGQQDTYLNVPKDQVLDRVKQCWASLYNAQAIAYRSEKNIAHDVAMAVVVQEMIAADCAGVMFTVDPIHKKFVLVEAARGLGEKVVSGEVTPSSFMLDPATFTITSRAMQDDIADAIVKEVARLGKAIERYYGSPQDVEFAVKDGTPFVLQSRAITTI